VSTKFGLPISKEEEELAIKNIINKECSRIYRGLKN
jgi:hypothetical protein